MTAPASPKSRLRRGGGDGSRLRSLFPACLAESAASLPASLLHIPRQGTHMFRIDPRYIGVEEARRREALAREIAEAWRDWAEFKREMALDRVRQLDPHWRAQSATSRDNAGDYQVMIRAR